MEVSVADFLEIGCFHCGKQAVRRTKVAMIETAAGMDDWKLFLQQSTVYM